MQVPCRARAHPGPHWAHGHVQDLPTVALAGSWSLQTSQVLCSLLHIKTKQTGQRAAHFRGNDHALCSFWKPSAAVLEDCEGEALTTQAVAPRPTPTPTRKHVLRQAPMQHRRDEA